MKDDAIYRQDAIDIVDFECGEWVGLAKTIRQGIEHLPSAQPEIIRCEDCMHNGSFDTDCPIDWAGKEYCNFAERRNDDV